MDEELELTAQAEEAEPKKKKGKGKFLVLLVLALVLGAGGFFFFNKGGSAAGEPELKLGETYNLAEFLVNLNDRDTYLRTEISIQFADNFDTSHVEEQLPAIQDAIIMKLTSKSLKDVQGNEGKQALKRELAADINRVLNSHHSEDEMSDEESSEETATDQSEDLTHPDWDSETGPVLKIYFTSFATQAG